MQRCSKTSTGLYGHPVPSVLFHTIGCTKVSWKLKLSLATKHSSLCLGKVFNVSEIGDKFQDSAVEKREP